MVDAAIRHQIILLDAVMWYHTARAQAMRDIIVSGQLGDIRQVSSAFTFPGNALADDNLRFSASLGGGSLLDVGWYCVGMSLWMVHAGCVILCGTLADAAAAKLPAQADLQMLHPHAT